MRICLYKKEKHEKVGLFEHRKVLDVQQIIETMCILEKRSKTRIDNIKDLILNFSLFKNSLEKAKTLFKEDFINLFAEDYVDLLAPIYEGSKIICLGKNYKAHAEEIGDKSPTEPVLFGKFASCAIGDGSPIHYPNFAKRVDPEVELGVIIGKEGKDISKDEALEHVFGYTVVNDVTERELEFADMKEQNPWFRSKNFDTFSPIGPYIVSKDEISDPNVLDIELRVNGEIRQKGNTRDMIFDIPYLISYISKYMTLYPGDVISTGTVPGIKAVHKGDIIEAEIEKIGVLRNVVE